MITQLRLLVGGTALAAGLWFLSVATAAPPALPKDAIKKAAEADISQLQTHLATCEKNAKDANRFGPTAKSLAMMLALDAEALGDKALKDQSLKVADLISAKKYTDALGNSKSLSVKEGTAPLAAADLSKYSKYGLDDVMSPFRPTTTGGLNLEKDVRGIRDGKLPATPAELEVLAARTATLLAYAAALPNDKATTNKMNTEEWTKFCKSSIDLTRQISEEAVKGKNGKSPEITKLFKALDAKCVDCHNKYRD